jgi:hypothetical protein
MAMIRATVHENASNWMGLGRFVSVRLPGGAEFACPVRGGIWRVTDGGARARQLAGNADVRLATPAAARAHFAALDLDESDEAWL